MPERNKKCSKISRSRPGIANKIIAFEEIVSSGRACSKRWASALLDVPNSTMQCWRIKKSGAKIHPEMGDFLEGPVGQKFLQNLFMAHYMVSHFGCGGIRSLKEFLHLSGLDQLIAASEGALHAFSVRCEEYIVNFGRDQETLLAEKMRRRRISVGLDEIYRGGRPCLVAIELISGYIFVEKFTEDRTAGTWRKELAPRLEVSNVELDQVVSDLSGSLRAVAKEMGATHVPELFHAQYEISKATSAGLAAQERKMAKELEQSEAALAKATKKYGEGSIQVKEATAKRNLKRWGHQYRKERSQRAKNARKELGRLVHPIDLTTGNVQTAEKMREKCDEHLGVVERCVEEAELSSSSKKGIRKAKRAFEAILVYVTSFLLWLAAFVEAMELSPEKEVFFNEVIFPLSYLQVIWKRLTKKQREELFPMRMALEARFEAAPYSEEEKQALMEQGGMCAEKFQRSSSCVEGRNGMLSLYHHRFHRLHARSCSALTVVHNFHKTRADGKTAAERFFGGRHDNLFESLVTNVRIPGKPATQFHKGKREKQQPNSEISLRARVA